MAERSGEWDGRNQRKWHMNREVSLGDVVGMLVAGAAILVAYGRLDTRVSLVEQQQGTIKADVEQTTKRLETAMGEINHKLDRLIERR